MKDDKKSSIIKEALTDYNAIKEAADANAKNRLAEEFPNKFNELLKEELQNKNKSKKESYKKLDESKESEKGDVELNKESVMKNQTKETKKVVKENAGEGKPFDEKAKAVPQVKEDVKITDTVGDSQPFDEKAKGVKKIDEEREKEFMADVESDTPNQGKGEAEKGNAFTDKLKNPTSGKPMSNLTEEFDVTELDVDSVGSALENAEGEDEVITMDEIENEIANMENLGGELDASVMEGESGDPFDQLVAMRNQLDEMIKSHGVQEQKNQGGKQSIPGRENGGPTTAMIDEKSVDEMHAAGGQERFGSSSQVAQLHQGNPLIDEESPITDADIEAVLGAEKPVDEAMGVSISAGTITPGKLGDHQGTHGRFRQQGVDESKKVGALIEENKKLTKKINETKKYKQSVTTLVESYKSALDKYRNQLKEMAIFNTNLAHVNNLLVNEELALTQEDKIKIINEFKKVDSIAASQNKYKAILTEMKESKKTLTESIENKVSASIQPSSKQKLDEVVEKTAYADDKHIQKMKKLIEYVEGNRGKKIIK